MAAGTKDTDVDIAANGGKQRCRLCGDWGGRARPKRLGRYALTCDRCEERRGSHRIGGRAGREDDGEPAVVAKA